MAGKSVASIRDRYRGGDGTAGPPAHPHLGRAADSRNYDAQILLGSLASYAFEPMRDHLERRCGTRRWGSGYGGRSPSSSSSPRGKRAPGALKSWVRELIRDSEELRKRSLYAGRSLDLELAITVPAAWSPPGDDWVARRCSERASNSEATIGNAAPRPWACGSAPSSRTGPTWGDREGTAQADRGVPGPRYPGQTRAPGCGGWRPRWSSRSTSGPRYATEWPDVDEPWFQHVQEAANELDNSEPPAHLRPGPRACSGT